jgi:hypothetical protein
VFKMPTVPEDAGRRGEHFRELGGYVDIVVCVHAQSML